MTRTERIVKAAVYGAGIVSALNLAIHALWFPQFFNHGLYGIVYVLFYIPQGLLLGAAVGYAQDALAHGRRREAATALVTGGIIQSVAAVHYVLGNRSDDLWEDLLGALVYFGVAVLGAVGMLLYARRLGTEPDTD